jgi:Transposase IS116/IS110/IS902 family
MCQVVLPGLGDRLAARVAGEIGDHIEQYATANALQCYAGKAPVTRRSGKSEFVVARRQAYNRFLGQAVQYWAFCSLRGSRWAREFYDAHRARGKSHHAALRALGNRWLEVLWHCLLAGVRYNEAIQRGNISRAQTVRAAATGDPVVDRGCLGSAAQRLRLRALMALAPRRGSPPGKRFGRLSCEDLVEKASLRDGPGGSTSKRVSSREDCPSPSEQWMTSSGGERKPRRTE